MHRKPVSQIQTDTNNYRNEEGNVNKLRLNFLMEDLKKPLRVCKITDKWGIVYSSVYQEKAY